MSGVWASKAPTEIVERDWEVPVASDDSLASYVVSESGVTLDADESNGDTITVTLSAGTVGATATVSFTATTTNGLVITETFYQPVRGDGFSFSYTVNDVCSMALRKVVGLGAVATADELSDATERLSDMLGAWAGEGADLSAKLPVTSTDTLFVPDWAIEPIKANLAVATADFYGLPLDASTVNSARRGLQRVKARLLPDEREGADSF